MLTIPTSVPVLAPRAGPLGTSDMTHRQIQAIQYSTRPPANILEIGQATRSLLRRHRSEVQLSGHYDRYLYNTTHSLCLPVPVRTNCSRDLLPHWVCVTTGT